MAVSGKKIDTDGAGDCQAGKGAEGKNAENHGLLSVLCVSIRESYASGC